jgi:hypothetical protein
MPENTIRELSDFELDAVTGGQPQEGLVNVNVEDTNIFLAVPIAANVNANSPLTKSAFSRAGLPGC